MDILFLTSQVPNPFSGSSIRPFYLIKNLSKYSRYNIYLITIASDFEDNYIDDIKKYCKDIYILKLNSKTNLDAPDVLKHNLSIRNFVSKIKSKNGTIDPCFYNQYGIQDEIDLYIKNDHFDCLYSDAGMAGFVAGSIIPKVIEPLDINYMNWFNYFISEKNIKKKLYWLIRAAQTWYREAIIFSKFNACVVVTEQDKVYADRILKNVVVIPNGTDIDFFAPNNSSEENHSLVFTGVMNSEKNIEAILYFNYEILPLIRASFPDIEVYIVGKSPDPVVISLGKDPGVIVTGFVEDIRPYLSRASIFICPHISGSGIKNKVLEAMAMGKPVVSTSIGALGINMPQETGILIADNAQDFADRINQLLTDKDLRAKIGRNARKIIEENYSWEFTAHKLSKIFDQIYEENIKFDIHK